MKYKLNNPPAPVAVLDDPLADLFAQPSYTPDCGALISIIGNMGPTPLTDVELDFLGLSGVAEENDWETLCAAYIRYGALLKSRRKITRRADRGPKGADNRNIIAAFAAGGRFHMHHANKGWRSYAA